MAMRSEEPSNLTSEGVIPLTPPEWSLPQREARPPPVFGLGAGVGSVEEMRLTPILPNKVARTKHTIQDRKGVTCGHGHCWRIDREALCVHFGGSAPEINRRENIFLSKFASLPIAHGW